MTPTDEALVAEARDNASWFGSRAGTTALVYPKRVSNLLNRLADRLAALLSQPPSGGWDDAAVERAALEGDDPRDLAEMLERAGDGGYTLERIKAHCRDAAKAIRTYRDVFAEITAKAVPVCDPTSDDPERVRGYRLPVGPLHRAAGKFGFQMFDGERHLQAATAEIERLHAALNAAAPRESLSVEEVNEALAASTRNMRDILTGADAAPREEVVPDDELSPEQIAVLRTVVTQDEAQMGAVVSDFFTAPRGEEGWEPIETAPSETGVLIFSPDMAEPGIAFAYRIERDWYDVWGSTDARACGPIDAEPTHWRPLPNPPLAAAPKAPESTQIKGDEPSPNPSERT